MNISSKRKMQFACSVYRGSSGSLANLGIEGMTEQTGKDKGGSRMMMLSTGVLKS